MLKFSIHFKATRFESEILAKTYFSINLCCLAPNKKIFQPKMLSQDDKKQNSFKTL